MRAVVSIAAVTVWLLTSQIVHAQDDTIRIATIQALSGPLAARGAQSFAIYKKNIDQINQEAGLMVGQTKHKIQLFGLDSQSEQALASAKLKQAITELKVVAAICDDLACLGPAEKYQIPTVLTVHAFKVAAPQRSKNVFVINAPSPDDFATQAQLAMAALRGAVTASNQPTSDNIAAALRKLDLNTTFGRIKFDDLGNNIGLVSYPFRTQATFRPDAAGCTNSCGSTCPKNCGQTACNKDGGSECCSLCGKPPAPQ